MAVHTDYLLSSPPTTNTQLLDFDAATWVVNIPVHVMKFAFLNDLPQAKAPTPQPCAVCTSQTIFIKNSCLTFWHPKYKNCKPECAEKDSHCHAQ